ncbi:MAG: ECF-type sigma factor, partial [Planctomycetota bacterium]
DLASDEKLGHALALDEVFLRLQEEDPQMADVVRLRFYAGLSVELTAEVLGIAPRTVKRHWALARAWMLKELETGLGAVEEA